MKSKSKLQLFAVALVACSSLVALSACEMGGGEDDQPSQEEPAPSDGSQSRAQLAGNYRSCALLSGAGTALNGQAFMRYLTLNADGSYSGLLAITGATACSFGYPDGANSNVIWGQVNVAGTWAVGGTNTTPSDSTKITFTSSSFTFTIYKPATVAGAATLANWAKNTCFANNFDPNAAVSTGGAFQTGCGGPATSGVNLSYPPTIGQPEQNIISKLTTKQTGQMNSIFGFGAGGFPSSYSVTWQ